MGKQIEIDLDVWKELVQLFRSEKSTESEVIRELLASQKPGGTSVNLISIPTEKAAWRRDGLSLPNGTKLRKVLKEKTEYGEKGDTFQGEVQDGSLLVRGKSFTTPTAAAQSITGYGVNGWDFWECKLPDSVAWIPLQTLRNLKKVKDE